MSTEALSSTSSPQPPPAVVQDQLRCALTGRPLTADEAYWAPPLVTMRELVGAVLYALFRAPATLGTILFEEQPNVPYAPEARQHLAARRSSEQLKLLLLLLGVAGVVAAVILLVAVR
jgi:hypothetical protein